MRSSRRVARLVAVSAASAGMLAGCGVLPAAPGAGTSSSPSMSRTPAPTGDRATFADVESVALDVEAGTVTVEGDAAAEDVRLRRTMRYQGERPSGATYEVDDGVLTLRGCGPQCAAEYTLTVPADLPVGGAVTAGRVRLTRVRVDGITSGAGEVSLTDIRTGAVDVRATNGSVTGTDLRTSGIEVRTTNGSVDLDVAKPQDVRARTGNGAIMLTVPRASYRVSATTVNGPRSVGVTDDADGEHELDLRTTNGPVTVEYA